jgi:hypothetical protein
LAIVWCHSSEGWNPFYNVIPTKAGIQSGGYGVWILGSSPRMTIIINFYILYCIFLILIIIINLAASSLRGNAARDDQDLSDDVTGGIRNQESHRVGDILGCGEPLYRQSLGEIL